MVGTLASVTFGAMLIGQGLSRQAEQVSCGILPHCMYNLTDSASLSVLQLSVWFAQIAAGGLVFEEEATKRRRIKSSQIPANQPPNSSDAPESKP